MPNYLRAVSVTDDFYKHAPTGGVILREECSVQDQSGIVHVASVVRWYDTEHGQHRTAHFDAKTGEYLGDTY